MARAGPKSKTKKAKAGPKSRKAVEKEEVDEVEQSLSEDEAPAKEENDKSTDEDGAVEADEDGEQSEEDNEPPPAKKGRGRPPAKGKKAAATPAKKAGRPSSRGRKVPAAKKKKEAKSDSEDEKDYEVEYVINVRKRKAGREFHIKWKGFPKSKSTWEPEAHLNCEDAIKDFEEKQEELKKNPPPTGAFTRPVRKETVRYSEIAGSGDEHRRRHSKRMSTKSPRKSYKEDMDSD